MGHDPQSGEAGARAVTAIWPHEDTLVEFEVGDATVTTTEDHEFWNVTDQAWQETQHIDAGDLLLTADGATVEAGTLLWDTAHVAPAFDPTIDEIHTYHVTADDESVLVHNNTRCIDQLDERSADIAMQARNNPNVGGGRTVGGGSAEINGQSFEYISQSGTNANQPPTGNFLPEPTDPIFGTNRITDAEYKIMEQVSADIDAQLFPDGSRPGPGDVVAEAEGSVAIVVDSPPGAVCDACRMVLGDFIDRYPNVEIQVRDTVGGVAEPIFN